MLRAAGLTTLRLQAKTDSDVIAGLAQVAADALIVQWAPVSATVLDAAPSCRFISRLGIGYDMIDVPAATERGVAVANTPDYCVDEVVAHTLAMALFGCCAGLAGLTRRCGTECGAPPSPIRMPAARRTRPSA